MDISAVLVLLMVTCVRVTQADVGEYYSQEEHALPTGS